MKTKSALQKVNVFLWMATSVITGILAGFLTSHAVMLGRYFSWVIDSDNYHIFLQTFPAFRAETHANVFYNSFFWISLAIGLIWVAVCFIRGKHRIISLIAGLSSLWTGIVFFVSGFSDAEAAITSGIADPATQKFFFAWNLPMHTSFAVFYTVCLILLLYTGLDLRDNDSNEQN